MSNSTHRRDFLKLTSVGVVAAGTGIPRLDKVEPPNPMFHLTAAHGRSVLPGSSPDQEDMTPWETPFGSSDEVGKICEDISKECRVTVDADATGLDKPGSALKPWFLTIDHGFKFTRASSDEEFSFFQFEKLLDQSADLLDRCLRDRSTWDEYAAKALACISHRG